MPAFQLGKDVASDSDDTEAASETEDRVEPDFADHGGPVIVDIDADFETEL